MSFNDQSWLPVPQRNIGNSTRTALRPPLAEGLRGPPDYPCSLRTRGQETGFACPEIAPFWTRFVRAAALRPAVTLRQHLRKLMHLRPDFHLVQCPEILTYASELGFC